MGKSVDRALLRGCAVKGTREIGCELEGNEGSEEAILVVREPRRHVCKVLMTQRKEVIGKEVKCFGETR